MDLNSIATSSTLARLPGGVTRRAGDAADGASVPGRQAYDLAKTARSDAQSELNGRLDDHQRKLGRELTNGIQAAGQHLDGSVSISVGAQGGLAIEGSAADKAKVAGYLSSETSEPRLQHRLSTVLGDAQAAAGGAGAGASYPASTATPPATLTVSKQGSSLAYAGALDVQA